jgi:serine O-acetyltransferase
MNLIGHSRESLADYTAAQIANLVPDGRGGEARASIGRHVDEALDRIGRCIDKVAAWRVGEFNSLHSSQYCQYLYYLANTIWVREKDAATATRIFLLNKAINGIDLFYEIAMPEVFYIGHSVGIVLAKATYGNHLVLYQHANVGRHKADIPVLGDRVILYPGSAVVGRAVVEDGAVLAQGTRAINRRVPANQMAFAGAAGELTFRPTPDDLIREYFRI